MELYKTSGTLCLPKGVEVLDGRQEQDIVDAAEMHVGAVWFDSIGRFEDP